MFGTGAPPIFFGALVARCPLWRSRWSSSGAAPSPRDPAAAGPLAGLPSPIGRIDPASHRNTTCGCPGAWGIGLFEMFAYTLKFITSGYMDFKDLKGIAGNCSAILIQPNLRSATTVVTGRALRSLEHTTTGDPWLTWILPNAPKSP